MTLRHSHPFARYARAFATVAITVSGLAVAASPVAASTATRAIAPICGPKTVTSYPAPGVGNQSEYTVASAGTVTLREQSTTTLTVTDADATSGWKDSVLTGSGTRVHVGFQQIGAPEEQERFWARLNTVGTPGTVVNVVLQSCT
jgi:hypothetical protein